MYLERKKEGGGRERKREERRVHNRKKREKSLFEINKSALSKVKSENSLHVVLTHMVIDMTPKGPKGRC